MTKLEETLDIDIKKVGKEEEFIKLYFDDLGKIWDLTNTAQKVFGELARLVEFNPQASIHNVISLNGSKRKAIGKRLGWAENTYNSRISQALTNLVEKKVVLKINNDTYLLTPTIASKANWADVKLLRSIKMEITYEECSRTLITFVESKDDFTKSNYKDIIESSPKKEQLQSSKSSKVDDNISAEDFMFSITNN
jgi:hypothetical protein